MKKKRILSLALILTMCASLGAANPVMADTVDSGNGADAVSEVEPSEAEDEAAVPAGNDAEAEEDSGEEEPVDAAEEELEASGDDTCDHNYTGCVESDSSGEVVFEQTCIDCGQSQEYEIGTLSYGDNILTGSKAYAFVPSEDGVYWFHSSTEYSVMKVSYVLYDSDSLEQFCHSIDGETYVNTSRWLTAGETYYITLDEDTYWREGKAVELTLTVEHYPMVEAPTVTAVSGDNGVELSWTPVREDYGCEVFYGIFRKEQNEEWDFENYEEWLSEFHEYSYKGDSKLLESQIMDASFTDKTAAAGVTYDYAVFPYVCMDLGVLYPHYISSFDTSKAVEITYEESGQTEDQYVLKFGANELSLVYTSVYTFTPEESGIFWFHITDAQYDDMDPYTWIYGENQEEVRSADCADSSYFIRLTAGEQYYVVVGDRTYLECQQPASMTVNIDRIPQVEAPEVTAEYRDGKVTLSWDEVPNETGATVFYSIFRKEQGEDWDFENYREWLADVHDTAYTGNSGLTQLGWDSPYVDEDVEPGKTYDYAVFPYVYTDEGAAWTYYISPFDTDKTVSVICSEALKFGDNTISKGGNYVFTPETTGTYWFLSDDPAGTEPFMSIWNGDAWGVDTKDETWRTSPKINLVVRLNAGAAYNIDLGDAADPNNEVKTPFTLKIGFMPEVKAPIINTICNTSDNAVNLGWYNSVPSEIYQISSYVIYRKEAGQEWTWGSDQIIAEVSAASAVADTAGQVYAYKDTEVISGKTYVYSICPQTSYADYDYMDKTFLCDHDTTGKSITYLDPILTSDLKLSNVSNGIKISWKFISGATGYRVYRKNAGGSYEYLSSTKDLTVTDDQVATGKTYTYAVRAYKGSDKAAYSPASIQYLAAPSVTLTNTANGIKASWGKVSGAKKYYVYRRYGSGNWLRIASVASTITYWEDTAIGNKNGYAYTYAVRAVGNASNSAYIAKTLLRLTTVSGLSVSNTATRTMTVKWTKNVKCQGYQIQYSIFKDFSKATTVQVNGATKVSAKIGSLIKGKTYYVRVRTFAINATTKKITSSSDWSAVKKVKIAK